MSGSLMVNTRISIRPKTKDFNPEDQGLQPQGLQLQGDFNFKTETRPKTSKSVLEEPRESRLVLKDSHHSLLIIQFENSVFIMISLHKSHPSKNNLFIVLNIIQVQEQNNPSTRQYILKQIEIVHDDYQQIALK